MQRIINIHSESCLRKRTCEHYLSLVPYESETQMPSLPTVNGHRKQQIELYREPTNTVSFASFIDPHLTYNDRCMVVLTGALRTSRSQR